jgi:peptidyl-dipeptidase Dcp
MRTIFALVTLSMLLLSCGEKKVDNPFFAEYGTPFEIPVFDKIKTEHYRPAFARGIAEKQAEIKAIADSKDAPTFANTIVALEKSGKLLTKVSGVFYNLASAHTSDALKEIAKELAPEMAKLNDDIYLNENLFKRVKTLHEQKASLNLTTEENTLLDLYFKTFVRGGANLEEVEKKRFREINERLSLLSIQFGENVLDETNRFEMVITDEADLAGLTDGIIAAAAEAAAEKGYTDQWLFTIHKPSFIPFLQYSEKRELRKKILTAYNMVGNNDDDLDNKKILAEMANLRVERANLLGYKTHAHFVLDENMAKSPENVYGLLDRIWAKALPMAKAEAAKLEKMMHADGIKGKLQPWDWWYYAEKLKKAEYDLDDEVLRPYFKLENVRQGVLDVASKLWGIQFKVREDLPKYHPDVTTIEVLEANGDHIGILFVDYFPRASKRGGAWMNAYRKQSAIDGKMVHPIICNVGNFTKPVGDSPSLLTLDEVETLFHEFGHALHGLLANRTYPSITGTDVARDFVEFPSQVTEYWATAPEVLKSYARHYQTNEPMPDALIAKMQKASTFNQGFVTVEYMSATYLDLAYHTQESTREYDINRFEKEALAKIGMLPEIVVRYRSPYFRHIFSGGYSSGYYSYIWAEVLGADAFAAFVRSGDLFNQELAGKYREHILAAGGSEDPMVLYRKFRGQDPEVEALLERRGLTN